MRKQLTKDHPGYPFTETALLLRKTRDDMYPVHNCDAVSQDDTRQKLML